jgi:hypothetical protein
MNSIPDKGVRKSFARYAVFSSLFLFSVDRGFLFPRYKEEERREKTRK